MKVEQKINRKLRRQKAVRKFISGNESRPRVSINRSNTHIYVQVINDEKGLTLASASDYELKGQVKRKPVEIAKEVGKLLGKKCKDKKIRKLVFDRSGYKYHGRVKAISEGLREEGLAL